MRENGWTGQDQRESKCCQILLVVSFSRNLARVWLRLSAGDQDHDVELQEVCVILDPDSDPFHSHEKGA